jgi:hypothetical protein
MERFEAQIESHFADANTLDFPPDRRDRAQGRGEAMIAAASQLRAAVLDTEGDRQEPETCSCWTGRGEFGCPLHDPSKRSLSTLVERMRNATANGVSAIDPMVVAGWARELDAERPNWFRRGYLNEAPPTRADTEGDRQEPTSATSTLRGAADSALGFLDSIEWTDHTSAEEAENVKHVLQEAIAVTEREMK